MFIILTYSIHLIVNMPRFYIEKYFKINNEERVTSKLVDKVNKSRYYTYAAVVR